MLSHDGSRLVGMNTQVMHNLLNTYALPAIIVFFSKLARKDCDSVVYNVNQIICLTKVTEQYMYREG